MSRKPTQEQMARIAGMMASGQITFDEAQDWIRRKTIKPPPLSDEDGLKRLAGLFPEKADALRSLLLPFLNGWKPLLRPRIPGLELAAANAIFWTQTHGVTVYRASDYQSVKCEHDTLGYTQWNAIATKVLENGQRSALQSATEFWLQDVYGYTDERSQPKRLVIDTVATTLFSHACAIVGDQPSIAGKFGPLYDLFKAGNVPVSYNVGRHLNIVVAD